jgi:hypothetical protein
MPKGSKNPSGGWAPSSSSKARTAEEVLATGAGAKAAAEPMRAAMIADFMLDVGEFGIEKVMRVGNYVVGVRGFGSKMWRKVRYGIYSTYEGVHVSIVLIPMIRAGSDLNFSTRVEVEVIVTKSMSADDSQTWNLPSGLG